MRRWTAIVRATALEILSEPLSLLLLVTALTLATLAPAFHYHQFGEATRMARDAGLSALLTSGLVMAVFGTIRSFRRELETGTAQMALAHPLSRTAFFLSKTLGSALACLVFAAIVAADSLTIVNGAAIGGVLAAERCDVARLWGPSLALGVATILAPLVVAAALNRFARFRFVLTYFVWSLGLSFASVAYRFDAALAARYLPAAALAAVPVMIVLSAAAAFSLRLRVHAAASATGLLLAALMPFVGNYYLSDALSLGAALPLRYILLATLAAVPAIVAFLLVGIGFINGKDVG